MNQQTKFSFKCIFKNETDIKKKKEAVHQLNFYKGSMNDGDQYG